MALSFPLQPNTRARTDEEVARILADPGFGTWFTDHMARAIWTKGEGWHSDRIEPYGPFVLDPSAAVLHYGQEIFEGLKAYRHDDGSVWLFRPQRNAERFNRSAARIMLPELPVDDFVRAVTELVKTDVRWVPDPEGEQSLYIRPFMFASEAFLGVRAAHEVTFAVIASPGGPYFANGVQGIDIWVTDEYARAGVGGTGAAKCGGNYAASLIAQHEGYDHGCTQVMFIEASTKDRVEELGGMNVFFVTEDGRLITPELSGTILDGVTRDSILKVGQRLGLTPEERRVSADEFRTGVDSGEFVEAFCCGTAAVISPISSFKSKHGQWTLANQDFDQTIAIRNAVLDIQYGRAEDPFGWMVRVA
jgi:branched-chain amino acid aminotransferase